MPATGRTLTFDLKLEGVTIPEGDMVMLNWASMCLDARKFENPSTLDPDRTIVGNPAFGTGLHRCAGAHLARMNIQTALRVWLLGIPDFQIKPGSQPTINAGIVREMTHLELEFRPG